MERDRILATLREHEQELKAAGLLHLRLFGSVARGETTPESDVDLLFDYDETESWNLLRAYGLQEFVSGMLKVPVHLSSSRHLRPGLQEAVLQEAVRAF